MTTPRQRVRLKANDVREQIALLEEQLRSVPVGVTSVSVDGTTTAFSRDAVNQELADLRRRLAMLTGARERVSSINLGNSF